MMWNDGSRPPSRRPVDTFRRYMVATAASNLAHATFLLVLAWAIAADRGALAAVGVFVVLGPAVRLLLTPVSGELADRVPASRLMWATRTGFLFLTLATTMIVRMHGSWMVLALLQVAASALLRIEQPAHRLLVHHFAAERPRARAFAANAALYYLAEIVAAAFAVATHAAGTPTAALLLVTALLALSLAALPREGSRLLTPTPPRRAGWSTIGAALRRSPALPVALLLPAIPGLANVALVTTAPTLVAGAAGTAVLTMLPTGTALLVALAVFRMKATDRNLLPLGATVMGVLLVAVLTTLPLRSQGVAAVLPLVGLGAARAAAGFTSAAWIQLHAPRGTAGRMAAIS